MLALEPGPHPAQHVGEVARTRLRRMIELGHRVGRRRGGIKGGDDHLRVGALRRWGPAAAPAGRPVAVVARSNPGRQVAADAVAWLAQRLKADVSAVLVAAELLDREPADPGPKPKPG